MQISKLKAQLKVANDTIAQMEKWKFKNTCRILVRGRNRLDVYADLYHRFKTFVCNSDLRDVTRFLQRLVNDSSVQLKVGKAQTFNPQPTSYAQTIADAQQANRHEIELAQDKYLKSREFLLHAGFSQARQQKPSTRRANQCNRW